jgi:cell shape-determining protein MreC
MKSLPEDFERELQLLDRYNRLLREFNRLKDENRQLKEQLGLSDTDDSQNSIKNRED